VLTHCTGGLNVDACKIPRGGADVDSPCGFGQGQAMGGNGHEGGSWPRNVVLSCGGEDCPAEGLDRQSGVLTSGTVQAHHVTRARINLSKGEERERTGDVRGHGDSGGASRYFTRFDDRVGYFGKAHRRDIAGRTDIKIAHPTTKSPALMAWLTRLLAATAEQTGGLPAIVLDPFMGSGTGGVEAVRARVRYIGIELGEVSFEEARARVMAAIGSPEAAVEANAAAPVGGQLGLL
jgi:hypothetical protein